MSADSLPTATVTDPCAMLGGVETRSVSPVFVGRAGELTSLTDALARATAGLPGRPGAPGGEPQALLIGGEAGVGKTRLVEEFLTAAGRREAVVAVGGCVEIGADGLPYAPFSTALRALRRTLPDEMAAACAGQEGELARLLPELGEADRDATDEHGTARLFELTARLLERISADRPVVLVLEDLHWADASTRHLLAYLFRTLRSGRLVVVGTYRADDIHRRHPCARSSPNWTGSAPSAGSNSPASTAPRSVVSSPVSSRPPRNPPSSTRYSNGPTATPSSSKSSPAAWSAATAPDSPTHCATSSSSASKRSRKTPRRSPGSSPRAAPPSSTNYWPRSPASPRTTSSRRCGEPSAPTCCSPRRRATATASGTRWSAKPSATICCPANAPGSTAATPRRWRPTQPSCVPVSAPPASPATGTAHTMRPRPSPPC